MEIRTKIRDGEVRRGSAAQERIRAEVGKGGSQATRSEEIGLFSPGGVSR